MGCKAVMTINATNDKRVVGWACDTTQEAADRAYETSHIKDPSVSQYVTDTMRPVGNVFADIIGGLGSLALGPMACSSTPRREDNIESSEAEQSTTGPRQEKKTGIS